MIEYKLPGLKAGQLFLFAEILYHLPKYGTIRVVSNNPLSCE